MLRVCTTETFSNYNKIIRTELNPPNIIFCTWTILFQAKPNCTLYWPCWSAWPPSLLDAGCRTIAGHRNRNNITQSRGTTGTGGYEIVPTARSHYFGARHECTQLLHIMIFWFTSNFARFFFFNDASKWIERVNHRLLMTINDGCRY